MVLEACHPIYSRGGGSKIIVQASLSRSTRPYQKRSKEEKEKKKKKERKKRGREF
jgi:hypothetical protein